MAQHVKVVTADGAAKKGALMFASTGTPRKQLIIHHVMQTVQFLAWFFKTKLDDMSGCAAFHHSLNVLHFITAWLRKELGMA